MMASGLIAASAGVVLALGVIHLIYTFWGTKLLPRDPALQARMAEVSLRITRETTVWRAWIGFNASHSLCAILFGLVYGYLSLSAAQFLFSSPFLIGVGFVLLASLCVLAKLYWFSIPFVGVTLSLVLYVSGFLASQV